MSVNAQNGEQESAFKVLRAVNPAVLGATQPLHVAKPKPVQFPNAQGGLRMVSSESEVRSLAHASADNIVKALAQS